jgi:hypothetical protein
MSTVPKSIRSPSYPIMPLNKALDAVGKIEKLYRSSPVDRISAVKLIGFTALSGPANKALAALAEYGLLERAGKGEARVTERARDILHAATEAQRKARIYEAAMEPPLYRELRERFVGIPVPPEDGVVTYLNRRGFNKNAVPYAAKAFLSTMSYLEEMGATESHGYTPSPERESGSEKTEAPVSDTHLSGEAKRLLALHGDQVAKPIEENFHLPEGTVTVVFPKKLSMESYKDLEDQLSLLLRRIKRSAAPSEN